MCLGGLSSGDLAEPQCAHLAGSDQLGQGTPALGQRNLGVDPVQVVQVDGVDAQPREARVDGRADVLRVGVAGEAWSLRCLLSDQPDLGRHDGVRAAP